jgi:hypothetical protein
LENGRGLKVSENSNVNNVKYNISTNKDEITEGAENT